MTLFPRKKRTKSNGTTNRITTRLPSSKLVVYLSVQKSRAAANVVGAYVWREERLRYQARVQLKDDYQ